MRIRKKFLAVGEACMAIFWPTPDGEDYFVLSASGFSVEGIIISASTVPYYGYLQIF